MDIKIRRCIVAQKCKPHTTFIEKHQLYHQYLHKKGLFYLAYCPVFPYFKVIMQGKLFQMCTHLLYCSVLSLGDNVNTRRISQPDMGSIFYIKNQLTILVKGNYYVNYVNYQIIKIIKIKCFYPPRILNKTLMHLFLFTTSALRELVSICTQSPRNCN